MKKSEYLSNNLPSNKGNIKDFLTDDKNSFEANTNKVNLNFFVLFDFCVFQNLELI